MKQMVKIGKGDKKHCRKTQGDSIIFIYKNEKISFVILFSHYFTLLFVLFSPFFQTIRNVCWSPAAGPHFIYNKRQSEICIPIGNE